MMMATPNRSLRRGLQALLAIGLALALVACGGPAAGDDDPPPTALDPLNPNLAYLTDAEAAERVQVLKNDAVSIANGFVSGALYAAIQGVPYSVDHADVPVLEVAMLPVPHLVLWDEGWTLATGTFAYNEATLNWTYSEDPADELIARWRSQSSGAPRMELRVTWSPTVAVTYPEDMGEWMPEQLPTGWRAVLRREGVAIADLSASYAFRSCAGVRMAEPTRLSLIGFAGDGAARADIEEFVIEAVGDDALRLSADISVRSGSLQLGIDASVSADLNMERFDDCWLSEPEAIELTGTLRVTGPGPLVLVRGDMTATIDEESGEYDLALRRGRFLSGDKRVDMVATIAATESHPLSRVFLTFAEGVVRDLVDFIEAFGLAE